MNISLENIDKVSAVLTIKMEKADYAERVEKALKDYRRKASLPGFRPGQVPMALLKKRFGKEITAEEVNKLLGEKLYAYIKDNKLNILGEPLPSEGRQQNIDFDTMEEFSFAFDIALAPEFKAELGAEDTVDYYDIQVDDKMVDNQVKMFAQRGGSYETVDSYEPKDMVKGLLAELDENGNTKEGGIQVENAVLLPEYMKDDEQKAIFNGCKVNDVVVFNPNKAYGGHDVEIAALLKIKKEDAPAMTSDFSYQVQEITRFKDAELSQELFDNVFGKDEVKSEEEFRNKIKGIMAEQFADDSNFKFFLDVRTYLMNKVGKLEFPDAFLKRFLRVSSASRGEKFVEEDYDKNIEGLTWQLIQDQLVKAYDIKVEREDLVKTAKNLIRIQFAQYGMINLPEELLNNYADDMLKKEKDVVTLNRKEISVEDFNKMFA